MSSTWYPVIDREKCNGCKSCFSKCTHGVYIWKDNRPQVVNPDGCCHGCHGCGNLCPKSAISYFGEQE